MQDEEIANGSESESGGQIQDVVPEKVDIPLTPNIWKP
jgi:hypothetical protein